MNKIVEILSDIQIAKSINNAELSRLLGVSETQISRLKSGEREPSQAEFLSAVMNVFPETTVEVMQYIKTLHGNGDKEAVK